MSDPAEFGLRTDATEATMIGPAPYILIAGGFAGSLLTGVWSLVADQPVSIRSIGSPGWVGVIGSLGIACVGLAARWLDYRYKDEIRGKDTQLAIRDGRIAELESIRREQRAMNRAWLAYNVRVERNNERVHHLYGVPLEEMPRFHPPRSARLKIAQIDDDGDNPTGHQSTARDTDEELSAWSDSDTLPTPPPGPPASHSPAS